jgi:hypothetical protein
MSTTWNDKTRTSWCLDAVPRRENKWLSLLSLRFGTILCNMIAIICFAWAMPQHIIGLVSTDGLGQTWAGINLGTVSPTHFPDAVGLSDYTLHVTDFVSLSLHMGSPGPSFFSLSCFATVPSTPG